MDIIFVFIIIGVILYVFFINQDRISGRKCPRCGSRKVYTHYKQNSRLIDYFECGDCLHRWMV